MVLEGVAKAVLSHGCIRQQLVQQLTAPRQVRAERNRLPLAVRLWDEAVILARLLYVLDRAGRVRGAAPAVRGGVAYDLLLKGFCHDSLIRSRTCRPGAGRG